MGSEMCIRDRIQTEGSLVNCIGGRLSRGTGQIRIIPEREFVDLMYPWFEARTAPLSPKRLKAVLDRPLLAQRVSDLNIRYFVWVEGSTERTGSAGSLTCSIGPGGGGCFGFGTWEDTSDYETTIWDLDTFTCLLYTSPSPRDLSTSRMPSSA